MHLTALVESPDHVCCRYRLAAFRNSLQQAGHSLELLPVPRSGWSWMRALPALRRADLVILQRKLSHPVLLHALRQVARRLVFDFDDAIFLRDSYDPRGMYCAARLRRFAQTVRAADTVVAGNRFLAEQAACWTDGKRIHIVPTCVDPERYPVARHDRRGEPVELVWIGSSSTLQGLERIQPLLEELGQRLPNLRLKLVCDRFLQLRHLPVAGRSWSAAGEAGELATADIGISWVPDDLWSRGKCGLKVLQYMAAGLPVVANPVGVQAEMVRHGVTGLLARTPDEWVEAIGRLMRDPTLRRRMGQAGRQRVEAEFSIATGAEGWLSLLRTLWYGRCAA